MKKTSEPPKLCGLGMRVTEEAPHRIVELIDGGAAKESHKLMVGDHILKIAGKETKSLSMSQVTAPFFLFFSASDLRLSGLCN